MKTLFLFNTSYFFPSKSYLALRLATGFFMCYFHGWSKLTSDSDRWYRMGATITEFIGNDALSIPLGFMAAFAESIGSLFIAIGLITRPMAFLLFFTMLVASSKKLLQAGIDGSELPLLYLFFSFFILLNGPGKYSLDNLITSKTKWSF
ncbi:MAG: DoxX family protein [Opitutales bacterium]